MHRFRKKSDVQRDQLPTLFAQGLPELPTSNDFRTSLILPDLSRRFSLLRTSSGEPVSFDDLKTKFAEQRTRGAEHQISEEEGDMLLQTLSRFRSPRNPVTPERSRENVNESPDDSSSLGGRQSFRTSTTTSGPPPSPSASSVTSSPSSGSRMNKRYSNNLFGSGKFKDYSYVRSVAVSQSKQNPRAASFAPTESSTTSTRENTTSVAESLRPTTPEGSMATSSVQSSPEEKLTIRSAPIIPTTPYGEQISSTPEPKLPATLIKRASLALDDALKEIEEETEEEIVMPRTAPLPRGSLDQVHHSPETRASNPTQSPTEIEAGMAISSDKQVVSELHDRGSSPSPVPARTLPGYIPGMPRPMTPRDFDPDDQRSHSTTPRATSPMNTIFTETSSSHIPSTLTTSIMRKDSTSSQSRLTPRPASPYSGSPLFLQRSTNGRYTPDDAPRANEGESENPLITLLSRRRPASPLSSPPFQPLTVTPVRPSTPSNVTWTTNGNGHSKSASGHSRNGSWMSDGGASDAHGTSPGPRSLRSPDSPTLDRVNGGGNSNLRSLTFTSDVNRPPSALSGNDLASPILAGNRIVRSGTPTQNPTRSPTSPTFSQFDMASRNGSRRSSRQNAPSPFSPSGPYQNLVFSPIANSSHSSLESVGSSYHSGEGDQKDRLFNLLNDIEGPQNVWHDFSSSEKSSPATTAGEASVAGGEEEWDTEEIIGRYAGLHKSDFAAMQDKLVSVAIAKMSTPDGRDRAPSLRRRRPSTSQSNYSVNGRETRIASPPPQTQAQAAQTATASSPVTSTTPTPDQYSKASALLNSVVDSILAPRDHSTVVVDTTGSPPSPLEKEASPTTRRNRDLAQVLFGLPDTDTSRPEPDHASLSLPAGENSSQTSATTVTTPATLSSTSTDPKTFLPSKDADVSASQTATTTSPYQLRNPSMPRIPPTPQEEADLEREVQQKANAAMMALRPGTASSTDGHGLRHHLHLHHQQPGSSTATGTGGSLISRKRINPNQISTPRLVSASTSVDTIPLRTPSLSSAGHGGGGGGGGSIGPSKIGSRFKKLRGTLRAKTQLTVDEEVSPAVGAASPDVDATSPGASQMANYDPSKLKSPGQQVPMSATDSARYKVPVQSPPASAGPGLKGFMARFRGKSRASEVLPEALERRASPQHTSQVAQQQQQQIQAAVDQPRSRPPIPSMMTSPTTPSTPIAPPLLRNQPPLHEQQQQQQQRSTPQLPPLGRFSDDLDSGDASTADAMQLLFKAAGDLGLDQGALSDLLRRSHSTSSRSTDWTLLTRNNSGTLGHHQSSHNPQHLGRSGENGSENGTVTRLESVLDEGSAEVTLGDGPVDTPMSHVPTGRLNLEGKKNGVASGVAGIKGNGNGGGGGVEDGGVTISRGKSVRTPVDAAMSASGGVSATAASTSATATATTATPTARRPREGLDNSANNAVVRRTLIFPSAERMSTIDVNTLARKNSSKRAKRASATSVVSSRSVHDRAPTPPPPKSQNAKRFSTEASPPLPQHPISLSSQANTLLNVPLVPHAVAVAGGPIEKSSSTYDSLYEMYAGETRAMNSAMVNENSNATNSESGPALEVIELANGETIWSIVNGLRDDDEESIYAGRSSFASEYSSRDGVDGGLQLFVKEHGRSNSKGSISSSFVSKKKPSQQRDQSLQGKNRPETKVFYSSSAQIGRLIENLSQGMEAGSFNFLPSRTTPGGHNGHSASSSLSMTTSNDIHWTVEERLEHMLGSLSASSGGGGGSGNGGGGGNVNA